MRRFAAVAFSVLTLTLIGVTVWNLDPPGTVELLERAVVALEGIATRLDNIDNHLGAVDYLIGHLNALTGGSTDWR